MLADLSDERVTQAVFTKDGTQDVRRDKWHELQDGALVLAPSTAFGGRGEWPGVTRFFHKDANREAGVPRRRFMTKSTTLGQTRRSMSSRKYEREPGWIESC